MSSLMTIEEEIENLPEHDFIILREWFQDLDSKKWISKFKMTLVLVS